MTQLNNLQSYIRIDNSIQLTDPLMQFDRDLGEKIYWMHRTSEEQNRHVTVLQQELDSHQHALNLTQRKIKEKTNDISKYDKSKLTARVAEREKSIKKCSSIIAELVQFRTHSEEILARGSTLAKLCLMIATFVRALFSTYTLSDLEELNIIKSQLQQGNDKDNKKLERRGLLESELADLYAEKSRLDLVQRGTRVHLKKSKDIDVGVAIQDAERQIQKDLDRGFKLNINGRGYTSADCSEAISALKGMNSASPVGTYTLLALSSQTLAILLKNATQKTLNETLKQSSENPQYLIKDIEDSHTIFITQEEDGIHIKLSVKHSLFNSERREVCQLDSSIDLVLVQEGGVNLLGDEQTMKMLLEEDVVNFPSQQGVIRAQLTSTVVKDTLTPLVPALAEVRAIDKQLSALGSYERIGVVIDGRPHLLDVADEFVKIQERYRLLINGEYIAEKEQHKKQFEKFTHAPSGQCEVEKRLYIRNLLQDTISTIAQRLGPKRCHLIPQITYFLNATGGMDIDDLHIRKYRRPIGGYLQSSYELTIPEDSGQPVIISIKMDPKKDCPDHIDDCDINPKNIRGEVRYLIYPDGRVDEEVVAE